MKQFISALLLTFLSFIAFSALADEPATYNQIVVFGDSLSDNGNLYGTTLHLMPKSPPYYQGHFSNGPTWADLTEKYFADKNNVTTANYAVGGETVVLHNPFDGYLPYTFKDSLNSYYLHTIFRDRSHTLFIIWLGANDYLNGSKDLEADTTTVVQAIQDNMESLISKGAKNFLVLDLPDLALTPFATDKKSGESLHLATTLHNTKLQSMLETMQVLHKDVNIHSISVYDFFNDLTAHTDDYNKKYNTHLNNITTACWTGGYLIRNLQNEELAIQHDLEANYHRKSVTSVTANNNIDFKAMAHYIATNPSLQEAYHVGKSYIDGTAVPCSNPDEYVFWDHVHPTAASHSIIGAVLIDYINQNYRAG